MRNRRGSLLLGSARLAVGALLASAGCADEDPGFQIVPADGFFEPTVVDFGPRLVGEAVEQTVVLTNNGGEALALRALDFEPRLDVFVVRTESGSVRGLELRPGGRIELVVVFGPSEARAFESTLVLRTDTVQVELPIRGEGRRVPPARLEGPPALSFGAPVELGRTVELSFGVSNTGGQPGRLVGVTDAPPFSVVSASGGPVSETPVVSPGANLSLDLRFTPTAAGPVERTVTLLTEGGDRLEIVARGEGIAPGNLTCDPPRLAFGEVVRGASARVAVSCAVRGGGYTLASASLEGGRDFTLERLSAGPGASVTAFDFEVAFAAGGRAGPRRDTVVIEAEHGARTELAVTATVAPPDPAALDVDVTLEWDADVDLDLHLVRAPAAPYTPGEDCHWDAATLDWGEPGVRDDDPYLDQDARRGPGVEVVSLEVAREAAYEVWVQYFDPNDGARDRAVSFDLAWSLAGAAVTGGSAHTLSACGQSLHVGRIELGASPRFVPVDAATDTYAGRTFRCGP